MNRERFEELLDDWAAGRLSAEDAGAFDSILASNPEWAEEARDHRALVELIREAPKVKAPAGLLEAALAEARGQAAAGPKVVEVAALPRRRSWTGLLSAAAALAVVATGSFVAFDAARDGRVETNAPAPKQVASLGVAEKKAEREATPGEAEGSISSRNELADAVSAVTPAPAWNEAQSAPGATPVDLGRADAGVDLMKQPAVAQPREDRRPNIAEAPAQLLKDEERQIAAAPQPKREKEKGDVGALKPIPAPPVSEGFEMAQEKLQVAGEERERDLDDATEMDEVAVASAPSRRKSWVEEVAPERRAVPARQAASAETRSRTVPNGGGAGAGRVVDAPVGGSSPFAPADSDGTTDPFSTGADSFGSLSEPVTTTLDGRALAAAETSQEFNFQPEDKRAKVNAAPLGDEEREFLIVQARAVGGELDHANETTNAFAADFPDQESVDSFLWRVRLVPVPRQAQTEVASAFAVGDAGTRDQQSRVRESAAGGARPSVSFRPTSTGTLREAMRGFSGGVANAPSAARVERSDDRAAAAPAQRTAAEAARYEPLNLDQFETRVEPLKAKGGYRVVLVRRSNGS